MPYDLFVSYSRKDNPESQVTELVAQIKTDYKAFTNGAELNCFFDVSEIKAMDDWRNRILGALKESNLLLLVLSPAYLASPYCEWEIVEFLKYENSRAVQGQGVAQVYFVEIPGLDAPGFEKQAAAWMARVRQRNHVDLLPWRDEGVSALNRADVRTRLTELEKSISDRLSLLRRMIGAPGNLPAHNPRFVGREVEMERLHKAAGLGQYGVLTAVQGVGGMGKTALAIQYAYAYADFYPGGRWMIGCARQPSLASAIRSLDSDLGIQFSDEEKLDDVRAAKRVLATLETRAIQGAAERAGERNPPAPRTLLILDNVDDPALLQTPQTDLFSGRKWLHVVATTRLDPNRIGMDTTRHCHLAVDELPDDDALRLIESYQPQGQLANETERGAAREIAGLLRGFTLAVEVVAVYLGERQGKIACSALLQRLRREGVDGIARQTTSAVNHAEKLMFATLMPTFETLTVPEIRTLVAAALLPPDSVPLPWLRAVVAENHPELGHDAEPGYDDPWMTLVNHLIGLRLLQIIEWTDDKRTPRLCRIHRLIQTVAKKHAANDLPAIENSLMTVVEARAQFLREHWLDWNHRWEISPLGVFAEQALDADLPEAAWFADIAARCMENLGIYAGAEPLFRRALEARERVLGPEYPDTWVSVNNLAGLLFRQGDYVGAEPLLRRALEANERVLGPEHPLTLTSVNNLAVLLLRQGDYAGAEPLSRRALEANERILGPEHPDTLGSVHNLAELLLRQGDYARAESLSRRVLEASERILGPEHPSTLGSVNGLAVLLSYQGDYAGAEPLYRRALEANERVLGPEHPDTLGIVGNLAVLLSREGDYSGAEPLYRRVLEANERVLGPEHSETLQICQNYADLLEQVGRKDEARPLRLRRLKILAQKPDATPLQLRTCALDGYKLGDYVLAGTLLRRVLAAGFEIPGTCCHLARIELLTDDLAAAREHLAIAWEHRAEAPPYVVPRILWLQLATGLAENHSPGIEDRSQQGTKELGMLKTVLLINGAHMDWTMDPVLAHLKAKLTQPQHSLLTALVAALSDRNNMAKLDDFQEWKNQPPVPLD